jgi:hypothetical protein
LAIGLLLALLVSLRLIVLGWVARRLLAARFTAWFSALVALRFGSWLLPATLFLASFGALFTAAWRLLFTPLRALRTWFTLFARLPLRARFALLSAFFTRLLLAGIASLALLAAVAGLVAARLTRLAVGLFLIAGLRARFAFALLLRAAGAFVGRFVLASAALAGCIGFLTATLLAAARLLAAQATLRVAFFPIGRADWRLVVFATRTIVFLVLFRPLAIGVVASGGALLLAGAVTCSRIAAALVHRAVGRGLLSLLLLLIAIAWLCLASLIGAFALARVVAGGAALLLGVARFFAGSWRLRAFALLLA